jgi:hypothetical protein
LIKSSLDSLNILAIETTRRLDDTYYSLLAKQSSLSHTVLQLKDLSTTIMASATSFNSEAAGLVDIVHTHSVSFDTLDKQQNLIESLEGRVKQGRIGAKSLGERLESVRLRIEGWEKKETEWQTSTNRRLRMLWSTIGLVVLIFMVLMCTSYGPRHKAPSISSQATARPYSSIPEVGKEIDGEMSRLQAPRSMEDPTDRLSILEELMRGKEETKKIVIETPLRSSRSAEESADRVVRMFDEL